MRILRVDITNFKNINFEGNKREKTPNKKTPERVFEFGEGGAYLTNAISQIYASRKAKHKGGDKKVAAPKDNAFDMEKILSIKLEEDVEAKPAPFEKTHGLFETDRYQQEAIDEFKKGKTTIVSAPTGTGKTLIAEHIIKDALEQGKHMIYLSPLKALSNEKYTDFAKLFGNYDEDGNLIDTNNVGLMTGDKTINPEAPILVMTTEIYRNSLLGSTEEEASEKYKDVSGVIYDEFHYMGEKQRGSVWEESVMYTPKHMQQLMLSATASNADEIQDWLADINPSIETHLVDVPESERHVPLREYVVIKDAKREIGFEETRIQKIDTYRIKNRINLSDRQIKALEEMKDIIGAETDEEAADYLQWLAKRRNTVNAKFLSQKLQEQGADKDKADSISMILSNPSSTVYKRELDNDLGCDEKLSRVIRILDEKQMTPALIYIFSKKQCNFELEKIAENSESLLTPEQSKKVYDEVQKCIDKGVFLGSDFDNAALVALMKGFAVHHAGKLPAYKSLVENLARQGLVKACLATETLIAGINMPFKTTYFTSLEKFDGEGVVDIPTAVFKQGGGRAGRRGKDEIGNVIVNARDYNAYEYYLYLSASKDTSIRSRYNPSYASILSDRMLNNKEGALLSSFAAHESGQWLDYTESVVNNKIEFLKSFGFIYEDDKGFLTRTEKGDIAQKVFGINEVFMTELLTEPEYLEGFTSKELIALAGTFADVKDEAPSRHFKGEYKYLSDSMHNIFNLVDEVDNFESYYMIKDEPTQFSTNLVPHIISFAEAPSDREGAIAVWSEVMDKMREKGLIMHEGDFLRVVNSTIDILKLIEELSPDENIRKEASIAIDSLRKPPVMDIYNYELGSAV